MNASIALIAIVLLASTTAHAQPKMCPHIVQPVCALTKDAKRSTFNNSCEADVAGARVLHDDACEGGDMCAMMYKPVCGLDPASGLEKTYSNLCVSENANAKIAHDGACKAP